MLQLHEPGEGRAEDEEEDDKDPELEVQSELSIKGFKEAIVSLEEVQKFLESRSYLEVSLQWTLLLHCKLIQLHSEHYLTIFHLSEHHYYHQQYCIYKGVKG